jgi:SOS-response transcriptional repressor LexA
MPATILPIQTRRGEYVLLRLALPGRPEHNVGVLLLDPEADRLYVRLRDHWEDIAGPEDQEYLSLLEDEIHSRAAELGAARFLQSLEDSLSNILRLDDREAVAVNSFRYTLDRLFTRHVASDAVVPFRTHLPIYSLRAAATRFGEDMQVEAEDWVRIPPGIRPSDQLFVAHVVGRSMEPRIPDGSLNIFRRPVVGSRQNKIVLVELLGELDDSARYTIKKYTSRKVSKQQGGEEEDVRWQHESIRLEPLNPEFQAFDLAPDGLRVIAEWIGTLE